MKVVVRNNQTTEFVKETGVYTNTVDEALDFLSHELASDFCDKHKLNEHEIIVLDESW
jgi:hypothetical protein